ncbi:hypothetical protein E0L35_19975 [Halomonas sp. ATBC28]|uniref:hypothetical protein n=1 Tax=Halomonas sp. ATBC28 TaxID=2545264 RepID=UPI00110E1114|nr:hypothetical protein [Halomonas sp. ATBC28]TMU18052.1 hypothetical protein E0L35_19975 [Halomonas sp. ATBC28]
MPFEELTILYFQIAAGVMMGWDYFTPKSWREHMNGVLSEYVSGVQGRVDEDLSGALVFLKVSLPKIIASFIAFGLAYFVLRFGSSINGEWRAEAILVTGLVYLMLVAGGLITLMNIVFPLLVPLGLGGVFRGITMVLTSTEKGPLAGLGFLSLLVSFVMRYMNYTAV